MLATLRQSLVDSSGNPMVGAVTSTALLSVLSEHCLHHIELRATTTRTEPSWGFWCDQNMSTSAEAWPNYLSNQADSPPKHGTLNHIFLCGGIGEWMYKHSFQPRQVLSRCESPPKVYPGIGPGSVAASFLSPRGRVDSAGNISATGDRVDLAGRVCIWRVAAPPRH